MATTNRVIAKSSHKNQASSCATFLKSSFSILFGSCSFAIRNLFIGFLDNSASCFFIAMQNLLNIEPFVIASSLLDVCCSSFSCMSSSQCCISMLYLNIQIIAYYPLPFSMAAFYYSNEGIAQWPFAVSIEECSSTLDIRLISTPS